jgi:putative ABC transport system permease protein
MRAGPADLASIAAEWRKYVPQYPFDYHFVDEVFASEYKSDQRLMNIFTSFCAIAVFAACIGLFGLFSMKVGERVKELSIRKVLGGSSAGAIYLLSKEFFLHISIAILLSTPVAWYCMVRWERDFAYHENITIAVFLFSGALSILLALSTIVFQALKATRTNPAKVLRAE